MGDIFSYGILLLKIFTGKKLIDKMFIDGLSIHKFTSMALPEHVMDIVESSMFFEEDEEDVGDERNEDDNHMEWYLPCYENIVTFCCSLRRTQNNHMQT